ncbi:MAG TPA: hypothetical protein VK507_02915 [Iamia sp.]|nr:hypothetical protein [Iamia sp.]
MSERSERAQEHSSLPGGGASGASAGVGAHRCPATREQLSAGDQLVEH